MRPACNALGSIPARASRHRWSTIVGRIVLLAGLAMAPVTAQPSRAGDLPAELGAWRAVEVRGTVLIRTADQTTAAWTPLAEAAAIAPPSEVATGPDGEAVLDNGVDHIRMSPNSNLVLPVVPEGSLLTRLKQKIGTMFFDVGPRPDRRFEVEAPYLVVLVKGTRFTVHSEFKGDSVGVQHGTVEVRAIGHTGGGKLLHPGETAGVAAGSGTVTVGAGTGVGGAGPGGSPAGQGGRGDGSSNVGPNITPPTKEPEPEPEPLPGPSGGGDGNGGGTGSSGGTGGGAGSGNGGGPGSGSGGSGDTGGGSGGSGSGTGGSGGGTGGGAGSGSGGSSGSGSGGSGSGSGSGTGGGGDGTGGGAGSGTGGGGSGDDGGDNDGGDNDGGGDDGGNGCGHGHDHDHGHGKGHH